jgi:hypothetical protein
MSLTLQSSFVLKTNSVMPLAQNASGLAIRVASQATDTLGTLTASGFAATPSWSLKNAPAWVQLVIDTTGAIATLNFTSAIFQADPLEFFISCTDGVDTVFFPIFMEVRAPFSIAANTSNPVVVNASTLNIPSYDSTVADVVIQGLGAFNTIQNNCKFSYFANPALPSGLNWVTSDETKLVLRVNDLSYTDLSGGLKLFTGGPTAVPFSIKAYQPGSFYDTPDRSYTLNLSIGSQAAKQGILDFGVAVWTDSSGNVHADATNAIEYLQGQAKTGLKFVWSATGSSTPTLVSGGTLTSTTAVYAATLAGNITISLTVRDTTNTITYGQKIIGPFVINVPGSWAAGAAAKIVIDAPLHQGNVGDVVPVTISSPVGEIGGGETLTVVFAIENESTLEGNISAPSSTTLTTANPSRVINVTIPAGSKIGYKWALKATATSGSRAGYAQALLKSNGLPPLTLSVGTGITSISSNTGASITPIQLSVTQIVSTTYELIGGVNEFGTGVFGAPDGLFINNQNQIVGNALIPGTYKFVVAASATGFSTTYSAVITMTVNAVAIPLQISNPSTSAQAIQDNTAFNVSWGISGTAATLSLAQSPSPTPIRTVTGSSAATVQQVGSSVYSIYGTSFYGSAYSVPVFVASSSIQALDRLLPSPVIATIDDFNLLTINWQPFLVNGDYTVYRGWNLFITTPPGGSAQQVFTTGLDFGGTASARSFQEQLTTGDYTLNMTALSNDFTKALNSNPWDATHQFPAAVVAASVSFDNTTLLLGQTLTITLSQSYTNADVWQVVFPDNTSTGWLPLSTRTVAKAFTTAGAMDIVIETQKDFSTSNPQVKLRRIFTQQIYVMNQQFDPQAAAQASLTGTLGLGGSQIFEITNATTGVAVPEPYEVVVRAIARDTITNELKLMVATTRFSNASSLLGTMAIDVFPILGRPHAKELIEPASILVTNANTSSVPVKIQTSTLPANSFVGKAMIEFKMTASGGNQPYSWFSDNLPPGIKMNIDGTISGTPTQLGQFNVHFAVMDASNPTYIDETVLNFLIPTDLIVSSTSIPNAQVGTPYTFQMIQLGGLPPYTWAVVAGQLPIGISIVPESGLLNGIPCSYNSTTDFSKTYTATIQVTDAIGAKASKTFSISLTPAALQYGELNQPFIVANEDFKLTVPVFGGRSPYALTSFTDNGIVGSGLQIVNPLQLSAVAGVAPSTLSIQTADQKVYVPSYPYSVSIPLSATGGVESNAGLPAGTGYKFLVDTTAANTLPNAAVYGDLLVAKPVADGTYKVTIKVIDSVGHTSTKLLNIAVQRMGTGEYTIAAYSINLNGTPGTPGAWTFTALPSGLPNGHNGVAYTPGAGQVYALVLLDNGVRKLNNGANPAVNISLLSGTLGTGLTFISANTQFSITTADCVVLIQGTPTVNASNSFELQLQGIINPSGVQVSTATRASITVTAGGGGTTPVVIVTSTQEMDIDLNTLVAGAVDGTYSWAYPLKAEGGVAPYTFQILSGTTLPGVTTQVQVNGLPAFSSATTLVSNTSYNVIVQATDSNSVVSAPVTIPVKIMQSTTQPTHLLGNNLPAYLYVNRPIPANTYYVDADLLSNWSATGLPAGVTLTSAPGTRVYLSGTPTAVSSNNMNITATSAVFGTTASAVFALQIRAQVATIIRPSHTGAQSVIGTQYRVVNNNSIISVQYTGFQPSDASLPTIFNTLGGATVGAPGVNNGGQPTTGNRALTADGFIMDYDYNATIPGADTISLKQGVTTLDSLVLTAVYPTLVASGTTVAQTVSEYTTVAKFNPPAAISGGNAPYIINITGTSDPRFTAINNNTAGAQLQVTVANFAAGQIVNCSVAMTITDTSSPTQTVNVTGTLQVTIKAETFISVNFLDYDWNISLSSPAEPQSGSIILNSLMSLPLLGHSPFTYTVDTVTIAGGLGSFVQKSPTNRVLAFNLNETAASVSIADVDQTLTSTGFYTVTATNLASAPAPGTYVVTVHMTVTDNKGIQSAATQHVNVKVSA